MEASPVWNTLWKFQIYSSKTESSRKISTGIFAVSVFITRADSRIVSVNYSAAGSPTRRKNFLELKSHKKWKHLYSSAEHDLGMELDLEMSHQALHLFPCKREVWCGYESDSYVCDTFWNGFLGWKVIAFHVIIQETHQLQRFSLPIEPLWREVMNMKKTLWSFCVLICLFYF